MLNQTPKLVDCVFKKRGREYHIRSFYITSFGGEISQVVKIKDKEKNVIKAEARMEKAGSFGLFRLEPKVGLTEKEIYDIADLCSTALHSAVIF